MLGEAAMRSTSYGCLIEKLVSLVKMNLPALWKVFEDSVRRRRVHVACRDNERLILTILDSNS